MPRTRKPYRVGPRHDRSSCSSDFAHSSEHYPWQKSIYGLLVFVARQHHRSVVTQFRSSRIRI